MATPKLRFKEFDGDWITSNFGKVAAHISYGLTVRPEYIENGVKLISAREISTGIIDFDNAPKMSESDFTLLSDKAKPRKYDLFLSKTGSIGFTAIVETNEEFAITQNIAVIRLDDLSKYNPYYFLHQMRTSSFQHKAISVVNQSTIMDLQLGDIKKLEIGYPSKEEQTKIAAFLSAVDEKISQLTQKHELLSQYKQGMMQKLLSQQIRFKADDGSEFGEWEEIKFLNLMDDLWDYRGKTPKKLGMDWGNGEIQSLSALNIKKGFIDFDADCHLGSESLYKIWMNKGDLEKNDIIFTMEAPLGNVALIPDDRKYILSQRVICFKTNKELVFNPFLFQLILSDQFQNRIDELATGTTAKGINQKSMQKIDVKIPCLEEQIKIANFLSSLDQKIDVVAEQIQHAKQWKKGLLQQMFV